jgi:hypothetical protein
MTGLQAAAELTQRLPGLRVLMLSVYIAIRYAEASRTSDVASTPQFDDQRRGVARRRSSVALSSGDRPSRAPRACAG